jgi:hypothetical protein
MRLSRDYFLRDLPARDDPKLSEYVQGAIFHQGDMPLVSWNDPRAVDRLSFHLRLRPQAFSQPCSFLSGRGLCPQCQLPYGSGRACQSCLEYRDHYQVLASVITFHSSAVLKDDFDVVLEHLLEVGPEARALITLETTARPLSMANLVIMFRGHSPVASLE